ncbi:phosphotransferase enzyme family protein [Colletotrichum higginsianum]|nr:phosphotransferase enzyme family protein [Colletotrichum higginsianum]
MTAKQPASAEASADVYEEYIHGVLREQYGREVVEITPLRHHNARVYELHINPGTQDTAAVPKKPGVAPLPAQTTRLIMRFSDPASMLNEEVRVQNEVAIMSLMREALGPADPSLVPEVYGWEPFSKGKGWTLIEFKQGTQIAFADKCDVVRGWKDSELRARLERFGKEGLKSLVARVDARLTLVHGDLDGHNILFDEGTNKLTALLDYDFGHVGSQADEYFYSFPSIHGLLIPPFLDDPEEFHLRQCLLDGFGPEDAERTCASIAWATAVARDDEFAKAGVERPADIGGIDALSAVFWFIQNISPPMFFLERWRSRATPDRVEAVKREARDNLERNLDAWGV